MTNYNPVGNPRLRITGTPSAGKKKSSGEANSRNFEDLAKKLVGVPKAEIDEQRRKA